MAWWNGRDDEASDSYGELEESNTEESLHGYNTGALFKRNKKREQALEEERRQTLEEEQEAIRLSRERNPQSKQDGKNIADESVNEGFWRRFL